MIDPSNFSTDKMYYNGVPRPNPGKAMLQAITNWADIVIGVFLLVLSLRRNDLMQLHDMFDLDYTESNFVLIIRTLGVACLVLGVVFRVYNKRLEVLSKRHDQKVDYLSKIGHKVRGTVVRVQAVGTPETVRKNELYSCKIIVSVLPNPSNPDNAIEYTSVPRLELGWLADIDLKSTQIPVDVYVDPTNPKSYFIDIGELVTMNDEQVEALKQGSTR